MKQIELINVLDKFEEMRRHVISVNQLSFFFKTEAATYQVDGQPLKIAKVETALRDLRRVGCNMHLVDISVLE